MFSWILLNCKQNTYSKRPQDPIGDKGVLDGAGRGWVEGEGTKEEEGVDLGSEENHKVRYFNTLAICTIVLVLFQFGVLGYV